MKETKTDRAFAYFVKVMFLPIFIVAGLLDLIDGRSPKWVLKNLWRMYTHP